MKCPKCDIKDTSVLDSRTIQDDRAIRRRRECATCGFRFTTFERIESIALIVEKKDGTRTPYIRSKLEEGVWRACTKLPVSMETITNMINQLEEKWMKKTEVTSQRLGEDVMEALRAIDHVAYIRFASVYKRFENVDEFQNAIMNLFEKGHT